jgi:hypothetical protein
MKVSNLSDLNWYLNTVYSYFFLNLLLMALWIANTIDTQNMLITLSVSYFLYYNFLIYISYGLYLA